MAVCDTPFIAARCEEDNTARSAADAGSSACSIIDRSCCIWVGDAFFGVDPRKNCFVENLRLSPLAACVNEGVGTGGEIVEEASYW